MKWIDTIAVDSISLLYTWRNRFKFYLIQTHFGWFVLIWYKILKVIELWRSCKWLTIGYGHVRNGSKSCLWTENRTIKFAFTLYERKWKQWDALKSGQGSFSSKKSGADKIWEDLYIVVAFYWFCRRKTVRMTLIYLSMVFIIQWPARL